MCVNQRAPPYAADTRAKGWRFELDHERIEQSITWALAPSEIRPWLLMLWMTAWKQAPCGSLEADDELIAARIGMPNKLFTKHRDLLLRGWCVADDGRLYHSVITERVLEMVEYREKAATRKLEYRERMRLSRESPVIVPRDSSDDVPRDSTVGDDTGTGTGTGTGRRDKKEKDLFPISAEMGDERSTTSKPKRCPPGFERFWKAYPRKVGKDAAIREFDRRKPTPELVETMVEAVAEQRVSEQWTRDRGKFIPHPSTWLHDGRWQDEPAEVNGADVFEGSR